jgi:hypothetical protein
MDYSRHYDVLITRAQDRSLSGYFEKHHIVPRCMGGTDEPDNLVRLTAEEHFVAHLLLVKIFPGNRKLVLAALAMGMNNGLTMRGATNKRHGWLRRRHSEAMKGRVVSPETREKLRAAQAGRKLSDETKQKMSTVRKGRKNTPETIERMRTAQIGKRHSAETIEKLKRVNKRTPSEEQKAAARAYRHTDEARAKIGAAGKGRKHADSTIERMRGRVFSPETKEKMRIAALKREAIRREQRGVSC